MNNQQSDCSDCSDEEEQDTTGTATFEPERQRDHIIPFPLFHLPSELADYIIDCADDRPQYPDVFPRGPSSDLLQFSLVSTYVHDRLRPAIWRSVRYIPQEGHRTRAYRKKRSLNALVILVEASERGRAGVVPIGSLSITAPGLRAADLNTAMTESGAIPDLIRLLTKMRVLLLDTCDFLPLMSDHVLTNILQHPSLTSLRLNQCTLNGKLSDLKTFEPMPRLKTLQIMHSSSSLLAITLMAPNLVSLLLWPKMRKLSLKLVQSVIDKLGTLRFLSLDVVKDPSICTSISTGMHRRIQAGEDVPIEELFFEGAQLSSERFEMIRILGSTNLKRLAIYNLGEVRPSLLTHIATSLPDLKALTIVQGDCDYPSTWVSPLEHYLDELSRLKQLTFFAFDRFDMNAATYSDTLALMGKSCRSLEESVAITRDVSEGSAGHFARYIRDDAGLRMVVKNKTVQDFLVSYGRWNIS